MKSEIVMLRRRGHSFQRIARELNTTVGQVRSCWQNAQDQCTGSAVPAIPTEEERDEITLLAEGPHVIYAYWEISEMLRNMSEQHIRQPWAKQQKYLRIYDCTDVLFDGHNAHYEQDIPLPEMTNNWFIRGMKENRSYIVDFGIWTREGTFFTLLRSNAIGTARCQPPDAGQYSEAVEQWKNGSAEEPSWLEQFCAYSYYEVIR
ncbi:DUF4912 domain-containing protein [Alkalihalobacillus oceani]|uniref:DUF4912 domain-containing protein n=1 Tax=Halalkalibacter oceani TaxID=1653776 RepID=A0A9X2DP85_9BACI|nr:DUF4912 domain-containing protein [Halalkalibacter oceani]MCM3712887.1 DUF4912 domain-containing protein [Halalkalibacter oceani]